MRGSYCSCSYALWPYERPSNHCFQARWRLPSPISISSGRLLSRQECIHENKKWIRPAQKQDHFCRHSRAASSGSLADFVGRIVSSRQNVLTKQVCRAELRPEGARSNRQGAAIGNILQASFRGRRVAVGLRKALDITALSEPTTSSRIGFLSWMSPGALGTFRGSSAQTARFLGQVQVPSILGCLEGRVSGHELYSTLAPKEAEAWEGPFEIASHL